MIKNIFFDFDGVLCESVAVKTEIFRKLYEPFGKEIADKVVAHHLAHTGVSRFEKIPYYHKTFLNIELSSQEVNEWAGQYSKLAVEAVLNAEEVAGAKNFLEQHYQLYKLWIISATPTGEIRQIVKQKEWEKYFVNVYGAPEKKGYWTEKIISEYTLKREETVFVGDALADQKAATDSGVIFILRRTKQNASLFGDYQGFEIKDLNELDTVIQIINKNSHHSAH
ncbi:HAD family hydrolase [Rubrolithibacter danxiaensis]|uniref:HAD family hydrolase n=1 Tax=Rubrolithibacter danxiaensis TaxID=3390805 RepID=UPI003BF7D7E9